MKNIKKYLIIGTLSTIPLIVTIQVIIFLYQFILTGIKELHGYTNTWENTFFTIIVLIIFLILVGQSVSKYGSSTYLKIIDKTMEKLPIISKIYNIAQRIIKMFVKEKQDFSDIVFVEYPRRGIWVPAYITNKFDNVLVLFVPTSPLPSSGFAVIVDKSEVVETTMTVEEATSFIVSVGASIERESLKKELDRSLKND